MKVSELYNICLELIENGKAHYDVCLVDREDYDIYSDINKYEILDEDDTTLGSLILND
jgi:hypothetical protein